MHKRRIVAGLILKNDLIVQSIGFNRYLPVGSLEVSVDFLNSWGIDEIIILDINATKNGVPPNFELLKKATAHVQTPITIGGGISSIDTIHELLKCGADKISLNNSAYKNPDFISEAARIFGNQCIVVSIDIIKYPSARYYTYDYLHVSASKKDPVEWAKDVEQLGAGEILLNSVHCDGVKQGFDIEINKLIADEVTIPVIACGGAGSPLHFEKVFKETGVSAACAGNFFHFTEHCANTTKAYLANKGIEVRMDTLADYSDAQFTDDCRIAKKSDDYLEHMLYKKFEVEVI